MWLWLWSVPVAFRFEMTFDSFSAEYSYMLDIFLNRDVMDKFIPTYLIGCSKVIYSNPIPLINSWLFRDDLVHLLGVSPLNKCWMLGLETYIVASSGTPFYPFLRYCFVVDIIIRIFNNNLSILVITKNLLRELTKRNK